MLRFDFLIRSVAAAAIATLAFSGIATAEVIVRVGGAWMTPDKDVFPYGNSGAALEYDDDGPVLSGDFTWIFTEHLGVELWANDKFNSGIYSRESLGNDIGFEKSGIGEVELAVPMLSLQWHFMRDSVFRPYVGGGVAFPNPDTSRPDEVNLDSDTGWQVGAGIDIGAADHRGFFANLFVKYADFNTKASLQDGTVVIGNWDLSPVIYGVGIGYRFGTEPAKPAPVVAAAPKAAPVAAAAPTKCADADNDGVCDDADRCPATPAGERVGPRGCTCDVSIMTHFAFDSAVLVAEDIAELERIAKRLNELEFVGGEVGGHTDSVGDADYNQGLSERRAQAVADFLAGKGVAPGRMTVVGFGELQPVADNTTEDGRAQNRRVVVRRTDCGPK